LAVIADKEVGEVLFRGCLADCAVRIEDRARVIANDHPATIVKQLSVLGRKCYGS